MSGVFNVDVAGRIASRMLLDTDSPDYTDELFAMSVRVPEPLKIMIDGMAKQVGVSRNTMAIDLLRAGIQNVLSKLPAEVAQELIEESGGPL